MILDPNSWDNMPEPLVDAQPLTTTTTKSSKKPLIEEMPWD